MEGERRREREKGGVGMRVRMVEVICMCQPMKSCTMHWKCVG